MFQLQPGYLVLDEERERPSDAAVRDMEDHIAGCFHEGTTVVTSMETGEDGEPYMRFGFVDEVLQGEWEKVSEWYEEHPDELPEQLSYEDATGILMDRFMEEQEEMEPEPTAEERLAELQERYELLESAMVELAEMVGGDE